MRAASQVRKLDMNRYQPVDGLLELLNSQLVGVNW